MIPSKQNIATVLNRIADVVFALDKNWCFTFLNTHAEIYFKSQGDLLLGENIWHYMPEEGKFFRACHKAMKKQEPICVDVYTPGNKTWCKQTLYPSMDGLTVLFKDIIKNRSKIASALVKLREAEDETKRVVERFDHMAKAAYDMIWDWNLITNKVWGNKNYNDLFRFKTEQDFHDIKAWIETVHPDDKQRVSDGLFNVINSGEKYWSDEYRCLKSDGTVLFVADRGYISHDKAGKPYRMIGSMLDITDRISSVQAIIEREQKYQNLFERASDSIVVHDMTGRILDINIAATEFSGYSTQELKTMNVADLLFWEDLEKLPLPFDRLQGGETTFTRRRVKTRVGIVRIMDVSSKMLPDGNVMAVIRDVTEKSEMEKALSNSEIRFRTLAGNAPTGIFETNSDGETMYVNAKMMEYTSLTFDELLGSNWIKSVHPEDRHQLVEEWKQNLALKRESSLDYRLVDKKGKGNMGKRKSFACTGQAGKVQWLPGYDQRYNKRKNGIAGVN